MMPPSRIACAAAVFLFSATVFLPCTKAEESDPQEDIARKKTISATQKEKTTGRKPVDPIKITDQSSYCIDCHRTETPHIFEQWINSTHAKAKIGCADCHTVVKSNVTGFLHAEKFYITTVVTPFTCAKCHKDQMRDYFTSSHARSRELLLNMKEDDPRYPIVEQYKQDDFRQCAGCHGGEVKVDDANRPDAATWPDSGAGRINPDKSHGTCAACHMGHSFSVASARQPEACLRCHDGANYPEGDIYRSSLHGTLYATQTDKEQMDRPRHYFGAENMGSPTCAFCHFNGAGHGLLTRHNGAWRLPRDLTSPEAPLAARSENLRNNMKSVCNQCHSTGFVDRFFTNADRELDAYQKKIVAPKLKEFQERLDITEGEEREGLLKEYTLFLAESKRYRMNLYMGKQNRVQR